ncbi:hypothetical protein GA0074692_2331 [Micromonospora pallida]|uniref:Uncharacterized protein n=1 Tax=Micromonospora pallida TaxID=145854 RepID=A0A1C6SCV7_9ACTN|nr:hypothetical protein [Micromonospora pallida]SCL27327.1 hypothetical protein GA0074692_2331 [Micromonospora pallida]
MPSSFSRFVSEEDLNRVRDEFLSALAELEAEEFGEVDGEPGDGAQPPTMPAAGHEDRRIQVTPQD